MLSRYVVDGVRSLADVPQPCFWGLSVQVHGCAADSYERVVGFAASPPWSELVVAELLAFLAEVAPGDAYAGGCLVGKWTHAWLWLQWDAPCA